MNRQLANADLIIKKMKSARKAIADKLKEYEDKNKKVVKKVIKKSVTKVVKTESNGPTVGTRSSTPNILSPGTKTKEEKSKAKPKAVKPAPKPKTVKLNIDHINVDLDP